MQTNSLSTVSYSAPEFMMRGDSSKASDIFSLGVLMWEVWTGCCAWAGARCSKGIRTHTGLVRGGRSLQNSIISAASAAGAPVASQIDENSILDAVIVGGGISGLTTALALNAEHKSEVGSFLEGPNSFQPSDAVLKAAVDAGCVDDLVLGDPKAPRFVYWEGRLRPTPSGPDVVTFDLMSLFGKMRAGLGAIGIKSPMPEYEESVEQFVRRNLGDEVFYRLIEPFCSGVYAGDPAKLSMKAAFGKVYDLEEKGGSIIGGVIKLIQDKKANPPPERDSRLPPKPQGQTVGSFRKGLQMLPNAIAEKVKESIRTGPKLIKSKTVALTVPSYVAADLFKEDIPETSKALNSFDYPPVAAVTITYPESAILEDRLDENGNLPGFGQLHPRTQGITTLGTIYSSSLFPGRVGKGDVLLLCYFGGALNRKVTEMTDEEIIAQVDVDLKNMLIKQNAPPPTKVAVRVWQRAIPQFNIGHLEQVKAAEDGISQKGWDGLFLGGNYVSGVALGKCIEYGYTFADKIAASMTASKP
eukprot:jgi/Picre1/31008/NNA_006366.t1